MAAITQLHKSLVPSVSRAIAPLRLPANQKAAPDLSFYHSTPSVHTITHSSIVRNVKPAKHVNQPPKTTSVQNLAPLPQSLATRVDSEPLASCSSNNSSTPSLIGGLDPFSQPLASTSAVILPVKQRLQQFGTGTYLPTSLGILRSPLSFPQNKDKGTTTRVNASDESKKENMMTYRI